MKSLISQNSRKKYLNLRVFTVLLKIHLKFEILDPSKFHRKKLHTIDKNIGVVFIEFYWYVFLLERSRNLTRTRDV